MIQAEFVLNHNHSFEKKINMCVFNYLEEKTSLCQLFTHNLSKLPPNSQFTKLLIREVENMSNTLLIPSPENLISNRDSSILQFYLSATKYPNITLWTYMSIAYVILS